MSYKIAILGTGNVAWHLARAFENAGHIVTDIYSRSEKKAQNFALDFFNANPTDSLDFGQSRAQVFILAVTDDVIEMLAQEIVLPANAVLAHTSGTVGINALGYSQTNNFGVFYPLQTFSKGKPVDISIVPIGIEAENTHSLELLTSLAQSISTKVLNLDSKARKTVHLSAVFACNFTNHMFTIAQGVLKNQQLDFDLLEPLILETLNKSMEIGPTNSQTGPAKRGDLETLDKHFEALADNPGIAEIYRAISQNIIDHYATE